MIGDKHLWGESWTIYRDKSVWVVGFRGDKGGESATHFHECMAHTIYVSSGYLVIRGFDGLEPQYVHQHSRRLGICDALEEHRLCFAEDSEGIETYYALPGHEIDEHDIVRLSPGRAPDAVPA